MVTDDYRIGIVNRGDAAQRLVHAVREYNLEHGTALTAVALHTSQERTAGYVRAADEAHELSSRDPSTGGRVSPYLDATVLEDALEVARLDAVWVGWGFVSEQAWFAELCEQRGVRFIGPSSVVLRRVGDKTAAKRLAEQLGIPVVPWSGVTVVDEADASAHAERLGYPLMLKSVAGGGGRGIRVVERPEDLAHQFTSASSEARSSSGDPGLLLERLVGAARHVEVQVVADGHGTVWAVGVRDCTVQRRRQKIVEEAGRDVVPPALDARLRSWAERLVGEVGYAGVGTVEFLVDDASGSAYFMEVNPRLQVEHTVTEATTGLDLVKLQLDLLRGVPLPDRPPPERGYAIEARITAEDPLAAFRPSPGRLRELHLPAGPGVRVDSGLSRGDLIPADFDPLVAKVIAVGATRDEALARLRRAVGETRIVIEGGSTTVGFLRTLLGTDLVRERRGDVTSLDGLWSGLAHPGEGRAETAVLLGAVESRLREWRRAATHLLSSAARGLPEVVGSGGMDLELGYGGSRHELTVHRTGESDFTVETPAGPVALEVERLGETLRRVRVGGRSFDAYVLVHGATIQVDLDGHTFHLSSDQVGVVRAPSPAVVVGLRAQPGDHVDEGVVLVVLESMKLEVSIPSPVRGVVRDHLVALHEQVDAGDALVIVEEEDGGRRERGSVLDYRVLVADGDEHVASADAVDRRLLGFDAGPVAFPVEPAPTAAEDADADRLASELQILDAFTAVQRVTARGVVDDAPAPRRGSSAQELLHAFLRAPERSRGSLPAEYLDALTEILPRFGAASLEPGDDLELALYRLCRADAASDEVAPRIASTLRRWLHVGAPVADVLGGEAMRTLEQLAVHAVDRFPVIGDTARAVVDESFIQPALGERLRGRWPPATADLRRIAALPPGEEADDGIAELAARPYDLRTSLAATGWPVMLDERRLALRALLGQTYRDVDLTEVSPARGGCVDDRVTAVDPTGDRLVVAVVSDDPPGGDTLRAALDGLDAVLERNGAVAIEWFTARAAVDRDVIDGLSASFERLPPSVRASARATVHWTGPGHDATVRTWTTAGARVLVGGVAVPPELHPAAARRLELWRYLNFTLEHLATSRSAHLLLATSREHPDDRRLLCLAEVHDLRPLTVGDGEDHIPALEAALTASFGLMRTCQARRPELRDTGLNRIVVHVSPPWDPPPHALQQIARRVEPASRNLGLDKILARIRRPRADGGTEDRLLHMTRPSRSGISIGETPPSASVVRPLTSRQRRALKLRRRGLHEPFEIVELLTAPHAAVSDFGRGEFTEYDLAEDDRLGAVTRAFGENRAGVVVGLIRNLTPSHPEGMERVIVLGDPSRGLGALAEPECRRILAALDLADERGVPVEWFTVSAGAQISMTSGTENMDWVARVLRRIVQFTQGGGEINIVVVGVNVGAQPYFNAEATMLMHTRGVLIMTAGSSMLLTGKEALDFAGGVSAEDNLGIGGYDRIMGPNGQAQYWASSVTDACATLLRHYELTYVTAGDRFPARRPATDPVGRDALAAPHPAIEDSAFRTLRDVFSPEHNPDRKRPFDVRAVMASLVDQDVEPLERWSQLAGGEGAVVWDARLGGIATCLVAIEARSTPRRGVVAADGPSVWTGSTLFPRSSKKVARALNAASGNRPVVVLANLAGFDGSPESLRDLQLEYGAEIGRAVTNFDGPIVFCVLSRYHGGAFVVFSRHLNADLEVLAVEGAQASVIGGSAAAAVVFAREVERRVADHAAVARQAARWERAEGRERVAAEIELNRLRAAVRSSVRADVAREFDAVHTVERALDVGSIDRIIRPERLRAELVAALERGIDRCLRREARSPQVAAPGAAIRTPSPVGGPVRTDRSTS